MPQIHAIKPTFAGGEFAPSMYSRVDVQRYQSGLKKLKNMIVHPHGGTSNRPGWHYVAKAKYGDKKFRLHDFQFSTTQTYVIEFGHQYIRFYTNGGQILEDGDIMVTTGGDPVVTADGDSMNLTSSTPYEIASPYTEDDLAQLNFTQSADVLFIFHPKYQTRQLNRIADNNWTLTLYDFLNGPFQVPNDDVTFTMTAAAVALNATNVTLSSSASFFDTGHVGGLMQINHAIAEQNVIANLSSVAATSSINCGGTWRIITGGTWTGTITVQKSTNGGSTWVNIRTFSSTDNFNANTFGTEDMSNNAPAFLVRVNMTARSSGTCNVTLTADAYRNVGVIKIISFVSATVVLGTITKTLGDTVATPDWAEGAWSDFRGWPAVGEFNQDRLVTGNTKTQPQTIWQTMASNYYDYSRSNPLADADGITTNLPSRQLNGVNGFVPLTQLIALTSASEWGITTTNGVMSPLTIAEKVFGYSGSSGIKPVIIKNRAIYVQFMGALVLDLGYELISDTFTGSDLSILANHLFTGYSIVDMAYQQYPDGIVWCVRNDGILLSMTYLREQEVIAWSWHQTQGTVETICSIPANGYNQVWVGVERGTDRFIEYMDHRLASTAPEDQFFVDCGIIYEGDPTDTIANLDHLEGLGVAVLADGNVVANYLNPITVTDGQISLPNAASKVIIGLPYVSDLETLNIEVGLPDGTMQGRVSRVTKVVMRVLNSRGGYIGPDENTLKEIADNFRTQYDTALALYTGDLKHSMGGGYSDGGRMFFRQIDPLPVTILALMPTVSVGGVSMEQ